MNKIIGIAGLGWLGKAFGQHLQTLGYPIKGTVTQIEKASSLQKQGFNTYAVELSESGVTGSVEGFLKDISVLVIMIPPGLRRNTGANYVLKMKHFLDNISKSTIQKVILISSTSVYDDSQGDVTEKDIPTPKTEAAKQLFEVEKLYFNAPFIETSIVRFGGLFGGSRQPVRYLAGRKDLSGGNAPVNLIHREDCIGILTQIIRQNAFGHIFNGVTPEHPTKKDYYTKIARQLNIEPPQYKEEEIEVFKKVDSIHLDLVLQYQFKKRLL